MPRVTSAQDNFTGGELSPLIDGRFSLAVYFNGLHRALNWLSVTQGVIRTRSGFRYIGEVKNSAQASLIPFRYSITDRYLMEFGNGYIRFYRNGALVLNTDLTPYEITSPYLATDVADIRKVQVGNTMYLVHPSYKPQTLVRGSTHTSWTLAAFAPTGDPFTGANLYPSVVCIYEQRLVMGATNTDPDRIWFSASGVLTNFTTGVNPADPFDRKIFQEELDTIEYLAATTSRLIVGTAGGESLIDSTNDTGVSPTNINVTPQTYYGSARVEPIKVDNVVLFLMRDALTVQSMEYDLLKEGFIADDRTLTADHITQTGVMQMVFQRGKPNVIWARRADGLLIGLTYEPRQQVFGWHRHKIAGTNSKVEALAVLPSSNGPDEFFVIVNRIVNGQMKRYIEQLTQEPVTPRFIDYWQGGNDEFARQIDNAVWRNDMWKAQRQLWHCDAAVRYDGTMTTSANLTGLTSTPAGFIGTGTLTTTGSPFTAGMVGRQIWDGLNGRATITAFTDANTVTVGVLESHPFIGAALLSGNWYLTAQTLAGLSHLEGETVVVIADGARYADQVVVSGAIALEAPGAVITVGLLYTCVGATMILDGGAANGPSQTKPKNVDRINLRLLDANGLEYGTDLYNLQAIEWRTTEDLLGRPPPLFSGDKTDLAIEDDWTETEKRIYLVQRQPQPATVQVLLPQYLTNDT